MIDPVTLAIPALFSIACLFWADGWANAQSPTCQVVCHGDSLTYGENASHGWGKASGATYPGILAARLGVAWRVTNLGRSGWTVDQLAEEAARGVDLLFDPTLSENVLIVLAGSNDLGCCHAGAETAFEALEAYCRARKAAHPWKILVVTPPMAAYPRVYPSDFNLQMREYGGLIRQEWNRFADGVIDIQADLRFGEPGCERNSRYFSPRDFTHLTDAGYRIVGEAAAQAVTKLVARHSEGYALLKENAR